MPKESQVDLHIRVPKELHAQLVKLAAAERRSLNNLLTVLLEEAAARKAQE
jgi:predicted HicB family RNase H-like nuclease